MINTHQEVVTMRDLSHSPHRQRCKSSFQKAGLLKKSALWIAIAAGASGYANAQDTTSSILGKITGPDGAPAAQTKVIILDRKSTRLNSSHVRISYAVFC